MDYEAALRKLKMEMEYIAGQWDGDKPGLAEDRAHVASDIMTKCDEMIELLDEMNDL